MSIDDDYFDLEADIEEGNLPKGMDKRLRRILEHVTEVEKQNIKMKEEYGLAILTVRSLHELWDKHAPTQHKPSRSADLVK